eukprot:3061414-Karenia_brevis.AAC.1
MQTTQQVCLMADHVKTNISDASTIMTVLPKTLEKAIKDLLARTTQPLVELYTEPVDENGAKLPADDGWDLLEKTKKLVKTLQSCQDLIASLHAKVGEAYWAPDFLHTSKAKAMQF